MKKNAKICLAILLTIGILFSLTACAKGADVSGKYLCVGQSYFDEEPTAPDDGSYIELKKNGKGTYYSGFSFDLKWKLDGEAFTGTVSFLGLEDTMSGTLKDGYLDVTYGDMHLQFLKEGATLPTGGSAADGSAGTSTGETVVTAPERKGVNANVTVADGLLDAMSNAAPVLDICLPGDWYGWVSITNIWGADSTEDEFLDATAIVKKSSSADRYYFEVYLSDDPADSLAFVSMWIETDPDDKTLTPDIGTEDAWMNETYLTAADEADLTTAVSADGGLYFAPYAFTYYSGDMGCTVEMFFRKSGLRWNENTDRLPPYYETYAAGLN